MQRRKKLYYIPGAVSLVFLPVVFYYYSNFYQKNLVQNAIPIIIWNAEWPIKYPELFAGKYPPERNYQYINLTGDDETDKIKLAFSQIRIREIIRQNDSINGIHFHFGDKATYASFINALDILLIENAKKYMVHNDDIWFMHYPPAPTFNHFICGTTYMRLKPKKTKISWWITGKQYVKQAWENSWQILLAYMVLVLFSLYRMIQRLRTDTLLRPRQLADNFSTFVNG